NAVKVGTPGFRPDTEIPDIPGYSEDGKTAAKGSFTGMHRSDVLAPIDYWMAGLFARLILLDPELRRIGWGVAGDAQKGWFVVIDVLRGRGSGRTIIYPVEDQLGVPTA